MRLKKPGHVIIAGHDIGQNLWHFDLTNHNLAKPQSWSPTTHSPLGWVQPDPTPPDLKQPLGSPLNGDMDKSMMNPNETLRSLLERLSLTNYFDLFQVCHLNHITHVM